MMKYFVFDLETYAVPGMCPSALEEKIIKKATTKKNGLDEDKYNLMMALSPLSASIVAISTAVVERNNNSASPMAGEPVIRDVKAVTIMDYVDPKQYPNITNQELINRIPEFEAKMLEAFAKVLDRNANSYILVGFNSDNFDIPFLRYRLMYHRINPGYGRKFLQSHNYASKIDLMREIYPFGAMQGLKPTMQSLEPAQYGNKQLMDGGEVKQLIDTGEWETLRKYSGLDAQMTAQLLKSFLKTVM